MDARTVKLWSREIPTSYVYSLATRIKFDSIFSLPPFVELRTDDGRKTCFYVLVEDDDRKVSTITPVILSKIRPGLNIAYCPAPPQFTNSSNKAKKSEKIIGALISYLKDKYNCLSISIEQKPIDSQFIKYNLDGCRFREVCDVMIDLSQETSNIYYNMNKRHRYALRKSSGCSNNDLISEDWLQKTSFTIRKDTTRESLQEFRALWIKTMMRMYESFSPLRRLLYRDPLMLNSITTVFDRLYPCGLVKLFTLYDEDGTPGASAIFFVSNNFTKIPLIYWSAGASSKEGRTKGLSLLLQWYIIRWFKEKGYQRYYMGGYDAQNSNEGPSLFKHGFGGQIVSGFVLNWFVQPIFSLYSFFYYAKSFPVYIKKRLF